jgi:hypothetical protein
MIDEVDYFGVAHWGILKIGFNTSIPGMLM